MSTKGTTREERAAARAKIDQLGFSVADIARGMGTSPKHLSTMLAGTRPMGYFYLLALKMVLLEATLLRRKALAQHLDATKIK